MPTTTKKQNSQQPRSKFYELLQGQVHNEFHASQQYTALAVWFDNEDLPELAKFFYAQAIEERNHAMALVQYMMDTDHHVTIPSTGEVRNEFSNAKELAELALEQEKEVTSDIKTLTKAARSEDDFLGEQFMQWFLKEQVEEVATMSTLVNVFERADGNLFEVERFVHKHLQSDDADDDMPEVAGGKL